MSYNGTDLSPDPLFLQTGSYDARSDRKTTGDEISAGVVGGGDYAVTYSGGTLVLNVAAGVAYIKGGNIADQGSYRQYISAGTTVTCPAADPSNPRIDTIIVRAFDNAADSSGLNKGRVECVPGTPTVGATLSNLSGKNSLAALTDLSLSFIVLAYVLVPAGATTLTSTVVNVKDARSWAKIGASSIALDPLIAIGTMNDDSASNTEKDWYGVQGTGLTIPLQYLRNAGSRVIIESITVGSILASSTPTHQFRVYAHASPIIDTGAITPFPAATAAGPLLTIKNKVTFFYNGGASIFLSYELEVSDPSGVELSSGYGTNKGSIKHQSFAGVAKMWADTDTTLAVRFTHQWGTANASNGFSNNSGYYKVYAA